MIQASELRVNNSVISHKHNGLITEIHSIMPSGVKLWANPLAPCYKFDEISGIPLTEELLLKMGFEKNVETDTWLLHIKQPISKHNFSFIEVSLLVTNDTYFDVYIDNNFIMICEFIHDLQNIVYMLGKKELTLS